MIYKLLLCLFIGFISYAASSSSKELLSREIVDSDCVKPGFMCKSCNEVAYCIDHGGVFEKVDMYECESGTTCSKETGECIAIPNPHCEISVTDYIFTCYQVGIFPDALSCFEYHICTNDDDNSNTVNPVSTKLRCPSEYYFDPLTTLCRLRSVNGTCPTTVINCTSLGETNVHPLNPALYYVCLRSPEKIYPQIIACSNDQVFNTTSKTCGERYEPPTAAGPDGKCKLNGYFYDPADCHNYFTCGAVGATPVARICATRMYFNTTIARCADFKCTDFE